jgi:hypothetical protein
MLFVLTRAYKKSICFILQTCNKQYQKGIDNSEFIRTWICKETSWRPSRFPWVAQGQIPAKMLEANTCEHNSYLLAILDRCGPSAKDNLAIHVSHLVLHVRDRVECEKLL